MIALLLIAHGSRDPRWAEPFRAIEARIRAGHSGPVALVFLESMAPAFAEGAARLATSGATRVVVVPLFLATGSHVRSDIPALVSEARTAHPGIDFKVLPAIGLIDPVQAAMCEAILGQVG